MAKILVPIVVPGGVEPGPAPASGKLPPAEIVTGMRPGWGAL